MTVFSPPWMACKEQAPRHTVTVASEGFTHSTVSVADNDMARVRQELVCQGFSNLAGSKFLKTNRGEQELAELLEHCKDLPLDRQAKHGERRRLYGRYVLIPYTAPPMLVFNPVLDTYWQPPDLNSDAGGEQRRFSLLPPAMADNVFLQDLIRANFNALPIPAEDMKMPFDVGVHVVEMLARPGIPGVSSPDFPHRDGEPYTCICLLNRDAGMTGGVNRIFDADKELLTDTVLTNLLDSQFVRDASVYHQVTKIEVCENVLEARRTVLLCDYTPLRPCLNQYE